MLAGDDRGQSVQVGAILLFGILILSLSSYQAFVVPQNNKEVEFNAYADATEDLEQLRNDLIAAGTGGAQAGTTVKTGVRYPPRAIFINPGPPAGQLRTTASQNITFGSNVTAVSGEEENTEAYWDLSGGERNYTTKFVEFRPAYNNIDVPPVNVTGSSAYRMTDNGPLALTGQSVVSGNRITLVTVEGNLSRAGTTTSVTAQPASVATRTVVLTGRNDDNFTITTPVPGTASEWNDSATADAIRSDHIRVYEDSGYITLEFDGTKQWELRLARVVVHERGDSGVDASTSASYIVPLDNGTGVPAQGTRRIAVEVRDKYNNPVSGETVNFTVVSGGTFDVGGQQTQLNVTTDGEGRATAPFNLTDTASEATVEATIVGAGNPSYNQTSMVLAAAGSGGGGNNTDDPKDNNNINPAGSKALVLQRSEINDTSKVDLFFDNRDGNNQNITELGFKFYSPAGSGKGTGNNQPTPPSSFEIVGTDGNATVTNDTAEFTNGGDYEGVGIVVSGSKTARVTIRFSDNFDVTQGDFFILVSIVEKSGEDGANGATYFAAPQN